MGATLLGLVALGASTVRGVGFFFPGLALLGVGGVLSAVVLWRRTRDDADSDALAQLAVAHAELERGNPTPAGWAASKAVATAARPRTRNRALSALAWASLGQGCPERAKAALDRVRPSHDISLYCLAAVEAARGRTDLAIQALEVARTAGVLDGEGAKLLVECHLRAFGIERAVLVATQIREMLGRANCNLVVDAARVAGAPVAAATLAALLRGEGDAKEALLGGKTPAIDSPAARRG